MISRRVLRCVNAPALCRLLAFVSLIPALLSDPVFAQDVSPATQPQPREQDWCKAGCVILNEKAKKGGFDVMLIGDSITWEWERNPATGVPVWESEIKPLNAATFAMSGDRTEHVLWRLKNGNLDTPAKPKVIVLLIGTNNTLQRKDPPPEIAAGVRLILDTIQERFPDAHLLLYGIFPMGLNPQNPGRVNNAATNALLARFDNDRNIHFIDLGPQFVHDDGTLKVELFRDNVHLSQEGYRIWAASLVPAIKAHLGADGYKR
jgi:lysophospholipase L1-like esterase